MTLKKVRAGLYTVTDSSKHVALSREFAARVVKKSGSDKVRDVIDAVSKDQAKRNGHLKKA